jgi:hypothetical protein
MMKKREQDEKEFSGWVKVAKVLEEKKGLLNKQKGSIEKKRREKKNLAVGWARHVVEKPRQRQERETKQRVDVQTEMVDTQIAGKQQCCHCVQTKQNSIE